MGSSKALLLIDVWWLWSSQQDVPGGCQITGSFSRPHNLLPEGGLGYGLVCGSEFTEIEKPPQIIKQRVHPLKKLLIDELYGKETCLSLLLAPDKLVEAVER